MRRLRPLPLCLFLIALAACGYKGPLYLPDEPPPPTETAQAGPGEDEDEADD